MTYTMAGQLGDWTFWAWDGHPFENHQGRTLYAYEPVIKPGPPGKPNTGEWFASLDRAMIAAIGEKYTGPRGAGGTGVGTAADWFARMIGMDSLVAVDHSAAQKAVTEVLMTGPIASVEGPPWRRAQVITAELEARGLVLAAMNHP